MITKEEEVLKFLDLDYKRVGEYGFVISPLNFMVEWKIVLILNRPKSLEMFIWDEDEVAKELITFQVAENICGIYSYLYEFKLKNHEQKNKTTKKQSLNNIKTT